MQLYKTNQNTWNINNEVWLVNINYTSKLTVYSHTNPISDTETVIQIKQFVSHRRKTMQHFFKE